MKSKDGKTGRTALPLSPHQMAEFLASLEKDCAAASEVAREDVRAARAEFAAARADPAGPVAKRLNSEMQVWAALLGAKRDGPDPMQQLESYLQAKRASARSATPRAFVLKEWAAHAAAYEFNKTQFAQDYRGRVLHEYGLKVSVRTIAERWLKS